MSQPDTQERPAARPRSSESLSIRSLAAFLPILAALATGAGAYASAKTDNALLADHVKQLEQWRDKHEGDHTALTKAQADLGTQVRVDEAQTAAILDAIHRLETKIDDLSTRRNDRTRP